MSRSINHFILVSASIAALSASPFAADAQGRGGGVARSAPTSVNRGGSGMHGTTPGGTRYATNGQGGAVAAGNGNWGAVGAGGAHNSGTYGTTAGGARYATGQNGAVAAKNGQVASTNGGYGSGNSYHSNTINTVNVDNGWNSNGYAYYHPVATGVAIGTAAAVTAAVIGSSVYTLPPSCVAYTYTTAYYACGGVWYQPQYHGTSVTYIVVNQPPH